MLHVYSVPGEEKVDGEGNVTPSCFSSSGIIEIRRNGGVKSTSNTYMYMCNDI